METRTAERALAQIRKQPSLEQFMALLCSPGLGPRMGKVEQKFVCNMLRGIYEKRSLNLTEIAKGLNEQISLHATHKRLSRNLDDPQLTQNLENRLLKLAATAVGPDTRLIVHVYDLNKKYAKKMEFMDRLESDSAASYRVCEILASDEGTDHYIPLITRVWSNQVPGFQSDADEIKKAAHQVMAATENRGLFYFDDASVDAIQLVPFLEDEDIDFISMTRNIGPTVLWRNEVTTPQMLVEQVETRYAKTMFKLVPEGLLFPSPTDMGLFMHAGSLPVKSPVTQRPLSVIALRTKSNFDNETATPLLTSRTNLRSRKALMGLLDSFLSMQDVIAAHRTLRESFDPENFRVLTYGRLQLLITLLQAVLKYEAALACTVSLGDHLFAAKPHTGEIERTYLLPEHLQNTQSASLSQDARAAS